MLINVPQYIDVEDKVAGPLTLKQLGWMIALGIILVIMWNIMQAAAFFVIGFPVAVVFLALAFYKPYGQPFGNFVIFAVLYYFRPKIYIWKRTSEKEQVIPKVVKSDIAQIKNKQLTPETIKGLAQLLDSEGINHNKNIEEILKQHNPKK